MRSSNTCRKGLRLSTTAFAVIAIGWLVSVTDVALAIDPTRAMSQYVRDHWGVENGFPKGPVYAITQTTDGYLWIGTLPRRSILLARFRTAAAQIFHPDTAER